MKLFLFLVFPVPFSLMVAGLIFPDEPTSPWILAPLSSLQCIPPFSNEMRAAYSLDGLVSLFVFPFLGNENKRIEGYLCRSMKTRTTCTVNFFGQRSLSYSTEEVNPSLEQCEISRADPQRTVSIEYPAASCTWWSVVSREHIGYEIINHPVIFDRYKNELLDPLFISGSCHERPCTTIHQNMIWDEDNQTNHCPTPVETSAEVFSNSEKRAIQFPGSEFLELERCLIRYCGMSGILSTHGDFFGSTDHTFLFPDCGASTEVKIETPETRTSEFLLSLESEARYERCQIMKEVAINSGEISNSHLRFLRPLRPGHWKVYLLNGTHLLENYANYIGTEKTIGLNGIQRESSWKTWIPTGTSKCPSHGPNGMLRDNSCSLVLDIFDMWDPEGTTARIDSSRIVIPHHIVPSSSQYINNHVKIQTEEDIIDLGILSGPHMPSLVGTLLGLGVTASVLGVVLTCCCCPRFCDRTSKKNNQSSFSGIHYKPEKEVIRFLAGKV